MAPSLGTAVGNTKSFYFDLSGVLFSPKRFFIDRFKKVSSKHLYALGFIGVLVGLLIGNILTYLFSHAVLADLLRDDAIYQPAISALGVTSAKFIELLETQAAYSILLAVLSPVIAYMAPHIFGGALFIMLWLGARPTAKVAFARVIECSAISLSSMAYYMVPVLGPLIAPVMVGINVSRALKAHYEISKLTKVLSILSAMYLSFFLASASLQLLAIPASRLLKG